MEDLNFPPPKRLKRSSTDVTINSETKVETNDNVNITDRSHYFDSSTSNIGYAAEQGHCSRQAHIHDVANIDIGVTSKYIGNRYYLSSTSNDTSSFDHNLNRSPSKSNQDDSAKFTSPDDQTVLHSYSNDLERIPLYCDQCLENYIPRVNLKAHDKSCDRSKGRTWKNKETIPDVFLKKRANAVCLECNKYLCSVCRLNHRNHVGYFEREDDRFHLKHSFSKKIIDILKQEDIEKRMELMNVENLVVLDRIQIKHSRDRFKDLVIKGICVVSNGQNWVVTDNFNKCMKVFESRDNKMIRYIKLSSRPYGITEVPCDTASNFSLAITVPFPDQQITIIEIGPSGASIYSVIQVRHEYTKICYLPENFVAFGEGAGKEKHFIHILNVSGEICNVIKLHDISGITLSEDSTFHIEVHKESSTIYISSSEDSIVLQMNLNGTVLNIFENHEIFPSAICVDIPQNVYMSSGSRPGPVRVYRLSQDFSQCDVILDDRIHNFDDVQAMTWYNDRFYISHEVRTSLENTVSIIRHE